MQLLSSVYPKGQMTKVKETILSVLNINHSLQLVQKLIIVNVNI